MSVQSAPMFWASCDWEGCEANTTDDDHRVWPSEARLADEFEDNGRISLAGEYSWLEADGKHYCGEHSHWDDNWDKRLVGPEPEEAP